MAHLWRNTNSRRCGLSEIDQVFRPGNPFDSLDQSRIVSRSAKILAAKRASAVIVSVASWPSLIGIPGTAVQGDRVEKLADPAKYPAAPKPGHAAFKCHDDPARHGDIMSDRAYTASRLRALGSHEIRIASSAGLRDSRQDSSHRLHTERWCTALGYRIGDERLVEKAAIVVLFCKQPFSRRRLENSPFLCVWPAPLNAKRFIAVAAAGLSSAAPPL